MMLQTPRLSTLASVDLSDGKDSDGGTEAVAVEVEVEVEVEGRAKIMRRRRGRRMRWWQVTA
jgi:hypothetical protein